MQEVITHNLEETQMFAEDFAKRSLLNKGDSLPIVITLSGELGAGKTTFTQGFAKGLGITNRIISPTFIISRKYEIPRKSRNLLIETFYHIDLFRMNSERDLDSIGLKDILSENDAVVVIEWPERMGSLLPEKRIDIKIESLGEHQRSIRINTNIFPLSF